MQLILAIDSDPRRSEQLANLVRSRLQVDLVQATSAGEGLHALRDRVPDLILTSPLLSPFDDGVLDEYLRDLGTAATHVQTVRIPMLSNGPRKKSAAKRLFSLGRNKTQTSSAAPDGCDPKVFADEIAHYLTRSLEGRSVMAKAAPAQVQEIEPEPATQRIDDDWGAPEALVHEFRETMPVSAMPIMEDTHVPGSILDLRTPIVHAPVKPEPVTYAFTEPEPVTYALAEPEPVLFVAPEPVVIEPEPVVIEPEPVFVQPEQEFVEPERPFEPVIVKPAEISAPRITPRAPASANARSTGNSASFEAALAAIRAAWEKPEPKTPAARVPASTAGGAKPAGSREVDLTKAIDALEDVTGVAGSTPATLDDSPAGSQTPSAHRKTDKPVKRPEKPRARQARSSGNGDDWSVLDANQYELSALVNKLDEVTEDEVTPRASNRR